MSISSMTNIAFNRRSDQQDVIAGSPTSVEDIARSTGESTRAASPATSTLGAIAAYIPTEVLTVYVAAVAALAGSDVSVLWAAFWLFLIATPIVVWLTYAGKVRQATGTLPASVSQWPKWEMAAATIAYVAWAFALPETPFAGLSFYSAAVGAVVVLVATTLIGLVAPVVQGPLPGTPQRAAAR